MITEIIKNKSKKNFRCPIDMTEKNKSQTIIFTQVKNLSTVLDVGCGEGELGITLNKMKSCKVYGIDNNSKKISIARKTETYEEIFNINLDENYGTMLKDYEDFFDCIILGDILEHLKHPQLVLRKLKKLLKDEGYILVSVPNVAHANVKAALLNNEFYLKEEGFINENQLKFFTYKTLPSFFSDLNFRIENLKYTFSDLYSCRDFNIYSNLPNDIIKYIFHTPHSFVQKYIIKAQKSDLSTKAVFDINQDFFNNSKKEIYKSYVYKDIYKKSKKQINLIKRYNFLLFINSCIIKNNKKIEHYKRKLRLEE